MRSGRGANTRSSRVRVRAVWSLFLCESRQQARLDKGFELRVEKGMARKARLELPEWSIVLLWRTPLGAELARGAIYLRLRALNLPRHV